MQELCYFQKVEGKPVTTWARARPRDVIIAGQRGGPEVSSTTKDDYVYLYIPFLGESGKTLEKNYHHAAGSIDVDLERYSISDIDTIPPFLSGIPIGEDEVDKIKSLYSAYEKVRDKYQKEIEKFEEEKSLKDPSYVRRMLGNVELSMKWNEKIYAAEEELVDFTEDLLSSLLQTE